MKRDIGDRRAICLQTQRMGDSNWNTTAAELVIKRCPWYSEAYVALPGIRLPIKYEITQEEKIRVQITEASTPTPRAKCLQINPYATINKTMANRIYSVAKEFETQEEKKTKVILKSKIHKTFSFSKIFSLMCKAGRFGKAYSVRK